jgi:hypothetical protein
MGKEPRVAEVEALIREIQRYLVFIEAFRARRPRPASGKGGKKSA